MEAGTLTIKTVIDNSDVESGLDDIEDIVEEKGTESGSIFSKVFTKAFSKIKSGLSGTMSKVASMGTVLLKVVKAIGISAGAVAGIVGAVLLLIGPIIAGVMILVNAFKKVFEENEQVKADLQYIVFAVNTALEPAVNVVAKVLVNIVNIIIKIVQYVAVLIKMLTGFNIFEKATPEAFAESMKKASEETAGATKNVKALKKQLAGFDEMNILQEPSSGGGGAGGIGGADFTMPSFDLSDLGNAEQEVNKFFKSMEDGYKQLKTLAKDTPIEDYIDNFGLFGIAVKGLLQTVYGQWEIWLGQFEVLGGLYDLIVAFFTGDEEGINKALEKIWGGIERWANGSQDRVWGLLEIFAGLILGGLETIWNTLSGWLEGIVNWIWTNFLEPIWNNIQETFAPEIQFFEGIWNGIKEVIDTAKQVITNVVDTIWSNIQITINNIKQLVSWVVERAKEIIKPYVEWIKTNIINPIKDKFTEMWDKVVSKVKETVQKVKDFFQPIIDFFNNLISKIVNKFRDMAQVVGDAISERFKSAINSVLGIAESILNGPIRAINKLIDKINAIPGISLTKLNTFSFPRLAKGGIVSMPGRGVPVGGAIAGERGQEAVLPLTDSQQMALLGEAIGKYITINANITNTMNGRVISRELQRINNESDFSFNR